MTDADRARFKRLIVPHLDAAYALAYWLTRNEDEARDAVQEAYLRALRYFGSFRGDEGRAWLMRIVRNACHDLRERDRHGMLAGEFDEAAVGPEQVAASAVVAFPRNPEAAAIERADARAVRECLRALPHEYREVLVLRELHDCSYKEIAAIAGVPLGTVMSRLARARRLMLARIVGTENAAGEPRLRRTEETGT